MCQVFNVSKEKPYMDEYPRIHTIHVRAHESANKYK